jgi:simple sugar transport system permease protein
VAVGDLKIRIPLCIALALLAAVLVHILFAKSRQGYEIKAVGMNPRAARYAGINVGRSLLLSMTLSGALAGLAGATYYLGYFNSIQPGVLSSLGFDSIAVALLGNAHPLGAIFASALIVTLTKGSTYMSSIVGVRQEIASLIIGMILLFSACGAYIKYRVDRLLAAAPAAQGGEPV